MKRVVWTGLQNRSANIHKEADSGKTPAFGECLERLAPNASLLQQFLQGINNDVFNRPGSSVIVESQAPQTQLSRTASLCPAMKHRRTATHRELSPPSFKWYTIVLFCVIKSKLLIFGTYE